jgi:hypothetical protein
MSVLPFSLDQVTFGGPAVKEQLQFVRLGLSLKLKRSILLFPAKVGEFEQMSELHRFL